MVGSISILKVWPCNRGRSLGRGIGGNISGIEGVQEGA